MFMYKSFCAHIALLPVFLNPPNDPSENFMLQYSYRIVIIDLVLVLVLGLESLVLVLEGQVLVNITDGE